MNKIIIMGRLVRDVEVSHSKGSTPMAIAKYTLAVNRSFKKDGEPTADFLNCVAFGKSAEFAEKYFAKGQQVAVTGRLQTGSYTNKDGVKVYTTDILVEEQHFAESKGSGAAASGNSGSSKPNTAPVVDNNDFDDDEIPF